jgi:aspartate carbamoyltransferase catalytic subunit
VTSAHLLSVGDLGPAGIAEVLRVAEAFAEVERRSVPKVPTLRGKVVATLFFEESTRTRLSFETAAKRLSADVLNLVASGSSVEKGESLRDTVATLSAYGPDAIVIRSPYAGAPGLLAGWTSAAVVNAGDGKHQHPTQALLDCYTLKSRLGSLDGANIWIVGDLLHSRVARSCIQAFTMLGANVTVAGPPTLVPDAFAALGVTVRHSLADLREADVIYALRMQLERMEQDSQVPSLREYTAHFQVNSRRLGPRQLLMHPGPVNRGIELSGEVIDSPQSLITEQVAAGVVVRMAVLYEVLAGAATPADVPDAQSRALEPQTA